jgi:hypothetical protein
MPAKKKSEPKAATEDTAAETESGYAIAYDRKTGQKKDPNKSIRNAETIYEGLYRRASDKDFRAEGQQVADEPPRAELEGYEHLHDLYGKP